ncbi:unnamed protein product [Tilletia laevis]|uniref:Uncharacterized protein n=1 Tax=Tilletia caries TaxID=13290 RepID=A0A177TY09_9BASI|nr:hypothetical protein CF336_g4173 [Tilletia laevis]KAE8199007.1 hypothetical protein CF328_g3378 [Tilletia controversa]KAE8243764.1 hypothetical protein A4X03_0g7682 [Tilletia caries]KAE8202593.1 hypothetical protein CF335_g3360 [Tilletia laevis]CAD6884192.1 unnamed protein product [Tilletia caries]
MDTRQFQQLQQVNQAANHCEFLQKLAELRNVIYEPYSLAPSASSSSFTSSTRDCHDDYHVGSKRRRTRDGSSSSHHGPGAISLDRLRELAGAPEAISAAGGSKHQASRLQPGELENIMQNVEFGRQLFAELIGSFSTLQGMKDEAEDDKERAEEQLSEANERIRELQSRVISSPLPSSWMSGNVGAATSDTRLVRRLRQVPRPPGRPSRGRTSSASVSFGSADITNASASTGTTLVFGSDATFNSRILELENALQMRDDTIEELKAGLETQAKEHRQEIKGHQASIMSLRQTCDRVRKDADEGWGRCGKEIKLGEKKDKEIQKLQRDNQSLQAENERLTRDVESWETGANELEEKKAEANRRVLVLKRLLERQNEKVAALHKETKALNRDNHELRGTMSCLEVEDHLSNKLKTQLQEEKAKLSATDSELRTAKSQTYELGSEVARLKAELAAKESELAEAQQTDRLALGTRSSRSLGATDGWASHGKSVGSQLAAAARKRAEAEMRDRLLRPDAGDVSQDMMDRSDEEVATTVAKKRGPCRKDKTSSSPLIDLFKDAEHPSVLEHGIDEDVRDAPVLPSTFSWCGTVDILRGVPGQDKPAHHRRARYHKCFVTGICALLIGILLGIFVFQSPTSARSLRSMTTRTILTTIGTHTGIRTPPTPSQPIYMPRGTITSAPSKRKPTPSSPPSKAAAIAPPTSPSLATTFLATTRAWSTSSQSIVPRVRTTAPPPKPTPFSPPSKAAATAVPTSPSSAFSPTSSCSTSKGFTGVHLNFVALLALGLIVAALL